jgi:hypothetical protein
MPILRDDTEGSVFEFKFSGARADQGWGGSKSGAANHFAFVVYFCSEVASVNRVEVVGIF